MIRVVSKIKLKYGGQIRRANVPFDANDDDVHDLVSTFGCSIVDDLANAPNDSAEKVVKKTRKSKKKSEVE